MGEEHHVPQLQGSIGLEQFVALSKTVQGADAAKLVVEATNAPGKTENHDGEAGSARSRERLQDRGLIFLSRSLRLRRAAGGRRNQGTGRNRACFLSETA